MERLNISRGTLYFGREKDPSESPEFALVLEVSAPISQMPERSTAGQPDCGRLRKIDFNVPSATSQKEHRKANALPVTMTSHHYRQE